MANPTTNYSFVLPTSSDLVTDLPADFDIALQGVDTRLKALQPGTTLGDLAYSSATANTNTRLPVGTNGQVLAVVAGVPAWQNGTTGDIEGVTAGVGISGGGTSGTVTVTNSMATAITTAGDLIKGTGSGTFDRLGIGSTGQVLTVAAGAPSWATPATSGGLTLIATASPSAATGVSFTSIPSYKYLKVVWFNTWHTQNNNGFYVQINSDTAANYSYGAFGTMDGSYQQVSGIASNGFGGDYSFDPIRYSAGSAIAQKYWRGQLEINGANQSASKYVQYSTSGAATAYNAYTVMGTWNNTATVSRIDFIRYGTQSLTGTFQLWGGN
jgi:hypothetical protein